MEVTLMQEGHNCPLNFRVADYKGMAEMTTALNAGMTPIVSYWSADDMLWLDGKGGDNRGACDGDSAKKCGDSVTISDFSLEAISEEPVAQPQPVAVQQPPTKPALVAVFVEPAATPAPPAVAGPAGATCPGSFEMPGYGSVAIVPTGWAETAMSAFEVRPGGEMRPKMGSRAYFADACTAGVYDHNQYVALKLLGKKMRYSLDVSGAGCGCNAAFYLTSMRQNPHKSQCSDYYCDANNVCGESCAEIDIQEANMFAWHSTLHTAQDHGGKPAGYGGGGPGWSGPRDFGRGEYGPGAKCIDTNKPFQVEVSFPVDAQGSLQAMEVMLSQEGHYCPLKMRIDNYGGMGELSHALELGMTPIVSYWSADNMLWMDGAGVDGMGACQTDSAKSCGDSVRIYDFAVGDIGSEFPPPAPSGPLVTSAPAAPSAPPTTSAPSAKPAPEPQLPPWAMPDRVRDPGQAAPSDSSFLAAMRSESDAAEDCEDCFERVNVMDFVRKNLLSGVHGSIASDRLSPVSSAALLLLACALLAAAAFAVAHGVRRRHGGVGVTYTMLDALVPTASPEDLEDVEASLNASVFDPELEFEV